MRPRQLLVFPSQSQGTSIPAFTNPTVRAFEKRLAALESASCGIATASGMSAILLLVLALLREGDHVVCSAQVFGSTVSLFTKILPRFGIGVDFVSVSDTQAWKGALSKKTRLLFLETPSNPLCEIGDIRALAELAHNANSLLVSRQCVLHTRAATTAGDRRRRGRSLRD